MIEQDLIDLGFKREDILDVESNNGYDYYYYFLKITEGLTLLSHVNHVTQLKEIVLCFQQN